LSVFYSFSGEGEVIGSTDGYDPAAGLIEGSDGNFYGATDPGGAHAAGSIFMVTKVVPMR
jgi:hypothetical protein